MASPADARAMVRRAAARPPIGRHLRTIKHTVRLDLVTKMAGPSALTETGLAIRRIDASRYAEFVVAEVAA